MEFLPCVDLKTLWEITGIRWKVNESKENNSRVCPWCNSTKLDLYNFNKWFNSKPYGSDNVFGINLESTFICILHAKLRITEKILKKMLNGSIKTVF